MSKEDFAILKMIKLTYTGEALDMQLKAWAKYPTLRSDCFTKALEKQYLRNQYIKHLQSQNA